MFETVEFPSEGALLRGRFYRPERAAPVSCCHHDPWHDRHHYHGTRPLCGGLLPAGLAVLLYDHRNFGSSGGEPRQQINPWIQARGYRDAMNYLLTRSDVRCQPDSRVG